MSQFQNPLFLKSLTSKTLVMHDVILGLDMPSILISGPLLSQESYE